MINGAAAGEDDKSLGWADWDVAGGKEEGGSVLDISCTSCCGAGWTIPFFLFAVKLSANDQTAKEIVHSNMKILSSFTYPCVISI